MRIQRLDWEIARQWQIVRDREKTLKELKKAVGEGALGSVISPVAVLRTKLSIAEERTERLEEEISSFKILPEYRDLETEAASITQKLSEQINSNTIDRELINDLENSITTEKAPSSNNLEQLYKEAGIILPGSIIKRFEEVKIFHDAIIKNRRSYLTNESEAAKQRILSRELIMDKLSERRAEIMGILQSHGVLEHYNKLQSELTRLETETETIRQQFYAAEQIEGQKTELDIDRKKLELRLRQDYQEQASLLKKARV